MDVNLLLISKNSYYPQTIILHNYVYVIEYHRHNSTSIQESHFITNHNHVLTFYVTFS